MVKVLVDIVHNHRDYMDKIIANSLMAKFAFKIMSNIDFIIWVIMQEYSY